MAVLLGATAAAVLAAVVLPGGVSSSQGTLRVALGGSCTHFGVRDAGLTDFPAAAAAAAVAACALASLSVWQSVRLEPWHMHTLGGAPGPGIRFRTQPQKPLLLQHSASEEQGVHMARHSAALAGAATATTSSSRLPSSSPCGTAAIGAHRGDVEATNRMMLLPLRLPVACAARRGGCDLAVLLLFAPHLHGCVCCFSRTTRRTPATFQRCLRLARLTASLWLFFFLTNTESLKQRVGGVASKFAMHHANLCVRAFAARAVFGGTTSQSNLTAANKKVKRHPAVKRAADQWECKQQGATHTPPSRVGGRETNQPHQGHPNTPRYRPYNQSRCAVPELQQHARPSDGDT